MNSASKKPDAILLAIVAAIAVLVVVALAAVFTRGEPELLDESTPAGVVQRYSTAVIEGDSAEADSYLTESARSICDEFFETAPPPIRVVLISTNERNDTALVRVSLVASDSGGLFGPSEYEMEDRFSLVKVNDRWMIRQVPYQLMTCPEPPAMP